MRTNQEHKSSAMIEFCSPAANRDILAPRHPCNRLRWLGVTMDPSANDQAKQCIRAKNSEADVLIIATSEETTIARHARRNCPRVGTHASPPAPILHAPPAPILRGPPSPPPDCRKKLQRAVCFDCDKVITKSRAY